MRLGIAAYLVPFVFVYNPGLLLLDKPLGIVMAIVTAIVGITSLAIGVEGHLFRNLNWPQRILLIGGGITLAVSSSVEQIYAVIAMIVAVGWHWLSIRATNNKLA